MTIEDYEDFINKKHLFFSEYSHADFSGVKLKNFNSRFTEINKFYSDDNDPAFAEAGANLVLGYNVLFANENFHDINVHRTLFPNFWSPEILDPLSTEFLKLKNYFVYTYVPISFERYLNDYKISFTNIEYFYNSKKSKKQKAEVVSYLSLDCFKAAFEAAPYFYRDYSRFLSIDQRAELVKYDDLPDNDKFMQKSFESIKDLLAVNNKYLMYSIFGATALGVLFTLVKKR